MVKMSSVNKSNKSLATEALIELDDMKSAIKEESKSIMKAILSETVRESIKKSINEAFDEDEDTHEDEYEIEDGADEPTEHTDEDESDDEPVSDGDDTEISDSEEGDIEPEEGSEEEDAEEHDDADGDEWSEYEDYKVEDGEDGETYDLSGEEDNEKVAKIYKLLNDDDKVIIKKDGDEISLKDDETGAEYVIKLDTDDAEVEDVEMDGEEMEEVGEEDDVEEEDNEFKIEGKMSNKEPIFEIDLGYTDNYQDKDPIEGLSDSEVSKIGHDADAGVPKGTKKPWAGKGSSKPFDKKSKGEVDEAANSVTKRDKRHVTKTVSHSEDATNEPEDTKITSKNGVYHEKLKEALARLQKENKEMKAIIPQLKKGINEAVLVNYKLGQVVRLVTENTTSKSEKVDIIKRFNENANSINECKSLYESISKELKKGATKNLTLESKQVSAAKSQINETTVYQSNDVLEALSLIKRMGC